jgi:hypothetical protein
MDFFAKKKIIVIAVLLVLVIIAIMFILPKDPSQREREKEEVKKEKEKIVEITENTRFSRVNFFLARPAYGSLPIPEKWEGFYRMKERGDRVDFTYIGEPESKALIFRVVLRPRTEITDDFVEVKEVNGLVFAYMIPDDEPYEEGEDKRNLDHMRAGVRGLFKDFKTFNIN